MKIFILSIYLDALDAWRNSLESQYIMTTGMSMRKPQTFPAENNMHTVDYHLNYSYLMVHCIART